MMRRSQSARLSFLGLVVGCMLALLLGATPARATDYAIATASGVVSESNDMAYSYTISANGITFRDAANTVIAQQTVGKCTITGMVDGVLFVCNTAALRNVFVDLEKKQSVVVSSLSNNGINLVLVVHMKELPTGLSFGLRIMREEEYAKAGSFTAQLPNGMKNPHYSLVTRFYSAASAKQTLTVRYF